MATLPPSRLHTIRSAGISIVVGVLIGVSVLLVYGRGDTSTNRFNNEMSQYSTARFTRAEQKKIDAFAKLVLDEWKNGDADIPTSYFSEHYDTYGGPVMAAALNTDPICHNRGHNLGRAIYGKTKDLALATIQCGGSCSSGCIHGAVGGLIEDSADVSFEGTHVQISDLTPALKKVIANICVSGTVTTLIGTGDCHHAVGHALAALGDDAPEAINLCSLFKEKGIGAEYYCGTGFYMQRDLDFGADDIASDDPLFPCTDSEMPIACMRYKIRRMVNLSGELPKARALCESLSGGMRLGCFHGLGFGAFRSGQPRTDTINDVCPTSGGKDAAMCVEGAVGAISIFGFNAAQSVCDNYTGDRHMCMSAISVGNFSMRRDFEKYMQR